MKKFMIVILLLIIIIIGAGYAVYYFGTNMASEKLVDTVKTELNQEQVEEIKQYVESDPELKQFVEEAETVDQNTLPFDTKEEATRVLVNKVGITKLLDIQKQAQEGTISKEEVIQDLQSKLTEEELMALKVIAYKELYNQ
jgi:uncharacterized protein YxeA